jgi:hypothetical protein
MSGQVVKVRTNPGVHFTEVKTGWSANTLVLESIDFGTYNIDGVKNAPNDLMGIIDHVAVYCADTGTAPLPVMDVVLFSKAAGAVTKIADVGDDGYIDHQPFVTTDFKSFNGKVNLLHGAAGDLRIPFADKDESGKIHVGIVNRSGGALTYTGGIVVELSWIGLRGV